MAHCQYPYGSAQPKPYRCSYHVADQQLSMCHVLNPMHLDSMVVISMSPRSYAAPIPNAGSRISLARCVRNMLSLSVFIICLDILTHNLMRRLLKES